jgi:transcriptional regulator with XRE-family HTH domain
MISRCPQPGTAVAFAPVESGETEESPERIFGRRVRRERMRRGWRQEDLAAAVADGGISLHPSAYAKIEGGTRTVTLNEAVAITVALDLPVSWMLSGDDTADLEEQLERADAELKAAMAESDEALQRAVNMWLERRRLIRDLASEGQMAITPAEEDAARGVGSEGG